MKILHVINTLSAGGAELHLLTLCRYLRKKNIVVVVACLREHVKGSRSLRVEFERENVRIINLKADSRYNSFFLGKLVRLLYEERPDILHTHLPRADFAGAFAGVVDSSVPWVCSVHGIYSEVWSGRWSLPLIKGMWKRADKVICISHAVRHWVTQMSVPLGRTEVIHYGIEPEKFFESRVNLREQWGIGGNAVIGSIGRLEPGKGFDCLIASMGEICQSVPNALLLIAGHDPTGYGTILRRLIDELWLKEKVRLVGFQSDVVSFLGALDVFAFASKSEGFGQVIVEAMAAGKPVVASKIPPLTEIVVDGDTGLFADCGSSESFASSLIRLLKDPMERQRMGARGRERVQKYFTAERMTQKTITVYQELMHQNSPIGIDRMKYSDLIQE